MVNYSVFEQCSSFQAGIKGEPGPAGPKVSSVYLMMCFAKKITNYNVHK